MYLDLMKNKRRILYAIALFVFVVLSGFLYWAYTPLGPSREALASLVDSETVSVVEDNWIRFHPDSPQTTGLVFYQGGHVDPRSYSILAHRIASNGYLVVIPKMPLNLAVLNKDAALMVMNEYPDVSSWVLAGHSLGGAMAASLVYDEPDVFQGLVLLAAYPPKNNDLSSYDLIVATIYGSNDLIASLSEIEDSLTYLPADAHVVLIEGGNHAQFGYYGRQNGDGVASITREQQHMTVIDEILTILKRLS